MQIHFTVDLSNAQNILNAQAALARLASVVGVNTPTESPVTKKAKAQETAAPAETEEEFDLGGSESEAEETTISLEDVLDAFKAYAKNNSGAEAKKILSKVVEKYKVKNIREVDSEHYSKILKLLN